MRRHIVHPNTTMECSAAPQHHATLCPLTILTLLVCSQLNAKLYLRCQTLISLNARNAWIRILKNNAIKISHESTWCCSARSLSQPRHHPPAHGPAHLAQGVMCCWEDGLGMVPTAAFILIVVQYSWGSGDPDAACKVGVSVLLPPSLVALSSEPCV